MNNPTTPGMQSKELKLGFGKYICTPMFKAALFTIVMPH